MVQNSRIYLSLNLSKGVKGYPVVTTVNPAILLTFKRQILAEWESHTQQSDDEIDALVARAEYQRLQRLLAVLIPGDGDEQEGK